jgi:hypothetical protein
MKIITYLKICALSCSMLFLSLNSVYVTEENSLETAQNDDYQAQERKFNFKKDCNHKDCHFSKPCNFQKDCYFSSFCSSSKDCNCQNSSTHCLFSKDCNKKDCDFSFKSSNCTITIKKVPFTISEPGVYCLADDFTISNNSACTGITIQASNVVLNLNGFSLSGGLHGIVIADCSINVIIQNGSIENTQSEGILVGKGSRNIQLVDLRLINTNLNGSCPGLAGILFNGTFSDGIKNSSIKNIFISQGIGSAIQLNFVQDCKISGCYAYAITDSPTLNATGFYIVNSNNVVVQDCATFNILASNTNNSSRGFWVQNSNNILFLESQASQSVAIAPAITAIGFSITNGECIECDMCTSSSQQGITANGFSSEMSTASLFNDCNACNNAGNGFLLSGDTNSCISHSISSINSINGFLVTNGSTNCTIGKSKAIANGATGFNLSTGNTNIIFFDNFAAHNIMGNLDGDMTSC